MKSVCGEEALYLLKVYFLEACIWGLGRCFDWCAEVHKDWEFDFLFLKGEGVVGGFHVVVCWGGVDSPLQMRLILVLQKLVAEVLSLEFQS